MCIQTDRRHHKALQCGNEYAKHNQLFLELYPGSVLFSPSGCKHSFVSLSCFTSVLFSLSGKHSFVSLSCPTCLVFSVTQASITSCHSAVLHLTCFFPSGKHSFVPLSCPTSVLFCSSGKPSFLLLSYFSSSSKS